MGVVGFGLLAGIIPLHGWVPQAHAECLCPRRRAVFYGGDEGRYLGIYDNPARGRPATAVVGVALLMCGMITAFVGGLYALMEHTIQRLLAYHTLENSGIILLPSVWAPASPGWR
ncbi:proton-conducting transporter membrane subunit [Shigella flexneri]